MWGHVKNFFFRSLPPIIIVFIVNYTTSCLSHPKSALSFVFFSILLCSATSYSTFNDKAILKVSLIPLFTLSLALLLVFLHVLQMEFLVYIAFGICTLVLSSLTMLSFYIGESAFGRLQNAYLAVALLAAVGSFLLCSLTGQPWVFVAGATLSAVASSFNVFWNKKSNSFGVMGANDTKQG
jgi:hypothetical protein